MAGSLRDQLVKAGLATNDRAKKAERQARAEKNARLHGQAGDAEAGSTQNSGGGGKRKAKNQARTEPSSAAGVRERARQLKVEKATRDRAIANVANSKIVAKTLRAEIRQIIQQNDQKSTVARDDDVPYNFLHGKKVKRIYVSRAQQEQLSSGSLVIVNNDGRYHLVSSSVADKISTRDPKRIIAQQESQSEEPSADDDYYARFKVPDDLDW